MFDYGIVTYVSREKLPCIYKVDGGNRYVNVGIETFSGPFPKVGDDVNFETEAGWSHHRYVEEKPTNESRWVDCAYYALQSKEIGLISHAGNEAKIKDLLTKMWRKAFLLGAMDSHYAKEKSKVVWGPYLNGRTCDALSWVATIIFLGATIWSLT